MKNYNWLYKVFLLTFILSIVFSTITSVITNNFNNIALILILVSIIIIGIIFDMIGVAVLTSKEATFHAKATKKIKGAKEAINLIKNQAKIASICNDVIGDICGIISGGLSAVLTINLCYTLGLSNTLLSVLITAFVSATTVGGKAFFKTIATKKSDNIIFVVGKIICFTKFKKNC